MSLRVRLCTSLLAAGLLLPGCTAPESAKSDPTKVDAPKVDAPKVDAPAIAPPAAQPSTPPAAASEPPVVTLLEPGAEPREPLRLKAVVGQTQPLTMTMKMAMTMDMGSGKLPETKIPPMQMVMSTRVVAVTPADDVTYEFTLDKVDVLDDPEVQPAVAAQVRAALGTMQKITGSSTVTRRGLVKAADFQLPPDVNPEIRQTMDSMRQSMNQMSVPFPEEALGVGARWTVTQNLDQQGMRLKQVSSYELKARTGDTITLATTLTQTADPQAMFPPGLPPGATVRLESLASSGEGGSRIDLTRLAPLDGKMTMKSAIKTATQAPGLSMTTALEMTIDMTLAGQ